MYSTYKYQSARRSKSLENDRWKPSVFYIGLFMKKYIYKYIYSAATDLEPVIFCVNHLSTVNLWNISLNMRIHQYTYDLDKK